MLFTRHHSEPLGPGKIIGVRIGADECPPIMGTMLDLSEKNPEAIR